MCVDRVQYFCRVSGMWSSPPIPPSLPHLLVRILMVDPPYFPTSFETGLDMYVAQAGPLFRILLP